MNRIAAVILAAGQGTRMKSSLPKVLHRVGGQAMVLWSVRNAQALGADPIVLVVGAGAEDVVSVVGEDVLYATQAEVNPPTFVFFVNDSRLVHFSYQRYLENRLRQAFGFAGTPIRLSFKSRGDS